MTSPPPVPAADGAGRVVPPRIDGQPRTGVAGTSGRVETQIGAETIYKSSARAAGVVPWRWVREQWNGAICDRIGCCAPTEVHQGRFCTEHRQAHGSRLLAQLAGVREHWRRIDEQMTLPPAAAPAEKETADER